MKVYICGNRKDEYLFYVIEKALIAAGHVPINPLRVIDALPAEINNSDFTVIAFEFINICNAVYLVSGWDEDLLARMEYAHAKRAEKEIME